MTAYLYDNNNYYLGTTTLQESPLETGVFFDQSNSTRISPPEFKENEIPYWNGESWEIKPNYSKITLYHKSTRKEKKYEIGETPDLDSYTEVVPLENERFQKFENDKWVIDEEAIAENEKKLRIMELRKLLLDSDFRMTTDYYKSMTPENQTYWEETRDSWRTELRDLGV